MNKPLIAALALGASLLATGAAHAGGNVQWTVGVNLPNVSTVISNFPVPVFPHVVISAPPPVVYREERRVVVRPAPRVVYQQPVVVYQPAPVYRGRWAPGYQQTRWDADGDGIPNRHDHYDNRRDRHGSYGDRDRDGVPNRYDRKDDRRDPRDQRKSHH